MSALSCSKYILLAIVATIIVAILVNKYKIGQQEFYGCRTHGDCRGTCAQGQATGCSKGRCICV